MRGSVAMSSHRSGLPVLMALVLVMGSASASPAVDDLLARLAPADGVIASAYVQTRESGLLTEAVTSEGELRYTSPGQLEKTEIVAEGERTVRIADATVHIDGPDGTRRFPLSRSRQLQALMALLEAFATGDAQALRERFTAELATDSENWRLRLQTRETQSGDRPSQEPRPLRVEVRGEADEVREILLTSPQGGRLRLELVEAER